MKKVLASTILSLVAFSAAAGQAVQVIWPFNVASTQATMIREVIEEANKKQNKYQFILVGKQGGDGVVAVNHVLTSNSLTLLGNSNSFFITPLLSSDTSYDVDQFKIVTQLCVNRPLAVFSKNLTTLKDKKEITVGYSGGSLLLTTKALGASIKDSTSVIYVPYKGAPESTTDMLGGHIDANIDWPSQAQRAEEGGAKVLGLTGRRNIANYKAFTQMGIKGMENLTFDLFIFANASIDEATRKELFDLLNSSRTEKSNQLCDRDFGQVKSPSYKELDSIFNENKTRWKSLSILK